MLRRIFAAVALTLLPFSAWAQSSPGWTYGQVLTAAQWNAEFATKQDVLGFAPLNLNGGTMLGKLTTAFSTTSAAGFNIAPGVAPLSPVDGDLWVTSGGLFVQVAGATVGPIRNGNMSGPSVSVVGDVGVFGTTDGSAMLDSGKVLPSGDIVGTTDSQVLTNKSIAASEVNSGTLDAGRMPAFTGDVATSAGSTATTIQAGAVTPPKMSFTPAAIVATTSALAATATSTALPVIQRSGYYQYGDVAPLNYVEGYTGTATFSANPANNDTLTVGGFAVTFVTGAPSGNQVKIQATEALTITAAAQFFQGLGSGALFHATATTIAMVASTPVMLAASSSAITLSGSALTLGGACPAADGGSQVASSNGNCWVALFPPGPIPPEQFGALANDTADAQPAIQAIENIGRVAYLRSGGIYQLHQSVVVSVNNSGITGPGSLHMPAAYFNCDGQQGAQCPDYSSSPNAVGVLVQNAAFSPTGIVLNWYHTYADGSAQAGDTLMAVSAFNVVNFNFDNLEIYNFPNATGIRVSNQSNHGSILNTYIHDFSDDTAHDPLLMACIDFDPNTGPMTDVAMHGNRCVNVIYGGVNVAQGQASAYVVNANTATNFTISDNYVYNTGQCIDFHGTHSTVTANSFNACYEFGIKLIHGASYNTVSANTINGAGLGGLTLGGGNNTAENDYNQITGNVINNIDPNGVFSANQSACILLLATTSSFYSKNNTLSSNYCVPGNAKNIYSDSNANDTGNIIDGMTYSALPPGNPYILSADTSIRNSAPNITAVGPTTGTTLTAVSGQDGYLFPASGTLATLTVVLPPFAAYGTFTITSAPAITTLTLSPPSGDNVLPSSMAVTANQIIFCKRSAPNKRWICH